MPFAINSNYICVVVFVRWNTDHAKEHVEAACRRSLNELNLEYLDLYLIHFPVPLAYVPPEKEYVNSKQNEKSSGK